MGNQNPKIEEGQMRQYLCVWNHIFIDIFVVIYVQQGKI